MSLQSHVNNSGFPLQLAIADLVKHSHRWHVLYEEHYWELNNDNGFVDLVIEDQHRSWVINIECKRVKDSQWIFLKDKSSSGSRRHAKVWITQKSDSEKINQFGWTDVPMDPSTHQSSYCIVPGQDSKSRPMLERTAATVVKSTEALATEETKTLSSYYTNLRIYQNVIVTTAELFICETDVKDIDISNGELGNTTEFKEVPYVRFRKQVGAIDSDVKAATEINGLNSIISGKESTIFIVNSKHFAQFLHECELPDNLYQYLHR